jgi:hypothetical protein
MYNRELFRYLERIKMPLAEVLGVLDPQYVAGERTPQQHVEKALAAAKDAMEHLEKLEQAVINEEPLADPWPPSKYRSKP